MSYRKSAKSPLQILAERGEMDQERIARAVARMVELHPGSVRFAHELGEHARAVLQQSGRLPITNDDKRSV